MIDLDLADRGLVHRYRQSVLDIESPHCCNQSPGQDVTRVVIQNRIQVIVTPIKHPELDKIHLSHLIDTHGFVVKGIFGADQLEEKTGQKLFNTRFSGLIPPSAAFVGRS